MLSRTSFFDPTLGKKGLKRTMPLWITHFIIWVMAMPVMLANVIGDNYRHAEMLEISEYVYYTVFIGGTLMACFFCAVIAGVLNNYLMSARSTSFYHSMPVRRSTVFSTHLIVTLGSVLIPAAVVGLMTWLVELAMGVRGGGVYILKWWGMYGLMCLFFTGFALLCIHVTGHVAAAPIIYAILNFTAVAVEAVVRYIPTMFFYGVNNISDLTFTWLSPIWHIYSECRPVTHYDWVNDTHIATALEFEGIGYLFALAAVGILMTGLAWLLYRMRHSEHAGEFIAIRPLRPVFKYCVTLGFTLILSIVLYAISYMVRYGEDDPSALWFTVCMLISAAIGYFGSEMLLKKSFRVFKKGLPGFAVCVLLILLGGASLQFDLFGIETYIPKADDIAYVEVNAHYTDYTLKILPTDAAFQRAIELHQLIIDNEAENKDIWNARYSGGPVEDYSWNTTWVNYYYYLQDGSKVEREYRLPAWKYRGNNYYQNVEDTFGYYRLLTDLHNDQVLVRRAYAIFFDDARLWNLQDVGVHPIDGWDNGELRFSNALYGQLREAVRMDIEAGSLLEGDRYLKYGATEPMPVEECFSLSMDFGRENEEGYTDYRYHHFTVTPKAVHTWLLLADEDNYVTIEQYEQSIDDREIG